MEQTNTAAQQAAALPSPLYQPDSENDYLMTPEEFLTANGYKSGGEYLNDCLDNFDTEADFGTRALCFDECVISPGENTCEHGCPSAAYYFEFQAQQEGDEV